MQQRLGMMTSMVPGIVVVQVESRTLFIGPSTIKTYVLLETFVLTNRKLRVLKVRCAAVAHENVSILLCTL
eukprot:2990970-Karenia_brevis.AAC.1